MKKINKILFSQDAPQRLDKSPYADFVKLYNVKIDFYKFFVVEPIPAKLFKQKNIKFNHHNALIMTSKNSIDHFFGILKQLNITISREDYWFFFPNASFSRYPGKYLRFRRSQSYYPPSGEIGDLINELARYPQRKFIFPCANDPSSNQLMAMMDERKIKYTKAEVFQINYKDIKKEVDIYDYDLIVFFSPHGVQAFKNSYPDFKQGNIKIAAMGATVWTAAEEAGYKVTLKAPTEENSSIFTAIEDLLKKSNARR